jgi:hypothetical protein
LHLLTASFISRDSKHRALRSRFSPSGSLYIYIYISLYLSLYFYISLSLSHTHTVPSQQFPTAAVFLFATRRAHFLDRKGNNCSEFIRTFSYFSCCSD